MAMELLSPNSVTALQHPSVSRNLDIAQRIAAHDKVQSTLIHVAAGFNHEQHNSAT
jgi:hypothetical protein